MEAQTIKVDLHRMIDNISDVSFLNALREIIKKGEQEPIVAYSVKGEPITKSQYIQDIKAAQERVKAGQYTSVEDLEKESEQW